MTHHGREVAELILRGTDPQIVLRAFFSGLPPYKGDSTPPRRHGAADVSAAVIYAPKTICLVSYWPFFRPFTTFLSELYRTSVGRSSVPIEVWHAAHLPHLPPFVLSSLCCLHCLISWR